MKKYHLKVLYPTSSPIPLYNKQEFSQTVIADKMDTLEAGCYKFYDNENKLVAAYPITYTIIEKIS